MESQTRCLLLLSSMSVCRLCNIEILEFSFWAEEIYSPAVQIYADLLTNIYIQPSQNLGLCIFPSNTKQIIGNLRRDNSQLVVPPPLFFFFLDLNIFKLLQNLLYPCACASGQMTMRVALQI